MMPCVANDDRNNEKPKSIYKPKYHAFSIDSLVGNTNNQNGNKSGDEDEDDNSSYRYKTLLTISPPESPNSGIIFNNNNFNLKILNENESTKKIKNDILRSYMTTSHNNYITSHNTNLVDTQNNNSYNQTIGPRLDTIIRSNIKLNNNSNNNVDHNDNDMTAISAFNNQYYYNQMYCRPYDNRFIQNAFVPQVCEYKSFINKSSDTCCQSSFNSYRKPKRIRTAFSPGQLLRLEEIFERNRYVVGCERKQLARDLNLSETQIKVWFQNRRTKHKREKHQENGHKKTSSASISCSTSITGNYSDNEVDYQKKY